MGRRELVGTTASVLCPKGQAIVGGMRGGGEEKAGQTVLCARNMEASCLCPLGKPGLWCLLCCSLGLPDRGTKQTPQGLSGCLSVPCRSHL